MKKAEIRAHDNVTAKNIEKVESVKDKVKNIESLVSAASLYNAGTTRGENAELLGF